VSNADPQENIEIERARYAHSQSGWITALYVLAFLRAAGALFAFRGALLSTGGTVEFAGIPFTTLGSLFYAVVYAIAGIAVYQRRLWGGYVLVAVSVLELPAKLSHGVAPLLGSAGVAACFVKGTIDLFSSKKFPNTVELDKWFILKWSLFILLTGALAGYFNPTIVELILGPPGSGVWIVALLFICAAQIMAVRRKAAWPLEHILVASLVALIVSGIANGLVHYPSDDLSGGDVLAYNTRQGLPIFVTAFVAYGISRRLKPLSPKGPPGADV
jgi:hypothetical protein